MELIEKEKAIGELMQQADEMKKWSDRYSDERKGILTAIRIIESVPKVDAETVIRCKDCRYNNRGICSWYSSLNFSWTVDEDDYCSCAERKEE